MERVCQGIAMFKGLASRPRTRASVERSTTAVSHGRHRTSSEGSVPAIVCGKCGCMTGHCRRQVKRVMDLLAAPPSLGARRGTSPRLGLPTGTRRVSCAAICAMPSCWDSVVSLRGPRRATARHPPLLMSRPVTRSSTWARCSRTPTARRPMAADLPCVTTECVPRWVSRDRTRRPRSGPLLRWPSRAPTLGARQAGMSSSGRVSSSSRCASAR